MVMTLNFFHKHIFENQAALDYLTKTRHLNQDIIIKYKLGYAPQDSQKLINYLKEK
jgi:DNA primase